jgi:hypothetical protein
LNRKKARLARAAKRPVLNKKPPELEEDLRRVMKKFVLGEGSSLVVYLKQKVFKII